MSSLLPACGSLGDTQRFATGYAFAQGLLSDIVRPIDYARLHLVSGFAAESGKTTLLSSTRSGVAGVAGRLCVKQRPEAGHRTNQSVHVCWSAPIRITLLPFCRTECKCGSTLSSYQRLVAA